MVAAAPRQAQKKRAPVAREPKREPERARAVVVPQVGKDERRKEILEAAVRVFAEKGYHGCRISDVAEEAGVAYGLVYHYFGNKDALLRTIFEKNWGAFLKAVENIRAEEVPLREKVRQVIDFLVNAYEVSPLIVKVFILEFGRSSRLGDALDTPMMGDVFHALSGLFTDAERAGELRPGVDARAAAVIFLGAIESALASFVFPVDGRVYAKGELDLERTRKSLHAILVEGVFLPAADKRPAASSSSSSSKKGR
jgi:TetR/AcrR family fatty acid metabolism transcriptional regulator